MTQHLKPILRLPGRVASLPSRIGKPLCARFAVFVCTLALSGCATYSNSFKTIEQQLAGGQYDSALLTLEEQSTRKTERVLYLLNKGMVQRMQRDFRASNQSLEAAKQEMERLYAASVSQNALSVVINDATVSYAGEDYEQVLVHLYMALNYLELGQRDEARVEALQVDIKLREIGEKVAQNKFTEDALSRYLTGMIYEELGERSDAMIAYRKAYEAYKKYQGTMSVTMPGMLKHDLLRLAKQQGLSDELAQYEREFGMAAPQNESDVADPQGELVFILNNGLAPIKRERIIRSWGPPTSNMTETGKSQQTFAAASPVLVNIALPYYESRSSSVNCARISASGKQIDTETMENIDAIAQASLDAHMPAITARAVARAATKAAMQKALASSGKGKSDNAQAALFILGAVASIATERADTRSWLTLPANIQLARLALPPGNHDVTVELLGKNGQVIATQVFPQVNISKAHKTYLTQHSLP